VVAPDAAAATLLPLPAAQALVLAISSHPLPTLAAFLATRRDKLLRADITSLLKAMDLSGH
jgi:pentatricopeptide repeat domain-containing protein 1